MHEDFETAINEKKLVKVRVDTNEKGAIDRICVPFDFGPSKRFHDGNDRYHFLDLDSPDGPHNLSILPGQLLNLEITDRDFEPGDYVTWRNPSWFIKRDWGAFS